VRLSLDAVERELTRLWEEEARRSPAPRMELMTLVALVSEPRLLERAKEVAAQVVRTYPSRTVIAYWQEGDASITADVALHRASPGGAACGDCIVVEALGEARAWLPENIDRLVLSDLPVCVWWVGDLPDFDDLFDRAALGGDMVMFNSGEMDLRDLEKLSSIAGRSRGRYAVADLTWIRLHPLQELVSRFFDDEISLACVPAIDRVEIDFAPREGEIDVASTEAGLLFGWMARALSLRPEEVVWTRGAMWGEAKLGRLTARFEHRPRADVPSGTVLRVALGCSGSRFEVERQDDPHTFRWSRSVPGVPTPPQTLRVRIVEEAALVAGCVARPRRDRLFELSLEAGSRIVRPIAPRPAKAPR
jgi:glucose-6-phosphate dehydrogenase assembly protein OpcA